MTVTKTTGKITFSFLRSALLSSVIQTTTFEANNIVKDGKSMVDEYGLSEDELDIFNEMLLVAHAEISTLFSKMNYGLTDANVIDSTTISYAINDKANYNSNTPGLFDENLFQAFSNLICREWFIKCSLPDLAKLYNEKYSKNVVMFIRLSVPLRLPVLT